MSPRSPCMEYLPEDLMVDILSRLPVKTIVHCKCVCKKWLNIVLDNYFADLQLSRSPAGFLIYHKPGRILKWVEVHEQLNHHNLHHDPVMSLNLNLAPTHKDSKIFAVGSVNGLVCLWQYGRSIDNTYICNPITREYMILPKPKCYTKSCEKFVYAFGAGSLKLEYKVIRIFQNATYTPKLRLGLSEAAVYTLGTGQWRSLGHVPYWFVECYGQFLNSQAHWTIDYQDSCEKICSFNFDNETFELFPSPPSTDERRIYLRRLGVLKGCLCRCDNYNHKLTIWVMKEYGIKNTWHKELVIEIAGIFPNVSKLAMYMACPVEHLKDGTILMESSGNRLIVYCPRRKAIIEKKIFGGSFGWRVAYRPSFHRLQNFENESVHVY